jgi:hypothetical protein
VISKEYFIRYPAGGRLRILESTNSSSLAFRAELPKDGTERIELVPG